MAKLYKGPTGYFFQTPSVEVLLTDNEAKELIGSVMDLMRVDPATKKDEAWLADRED